MTFKVIVSSRPGSLWHITGNVAGDQAVDDSSGKSELSLDDAAAVMQVSERIARDAKLVRSVTFATAILHGEKAHRD